MFVNRFSNDADSLTSRYEIFVEEFVSIVNRQAIGIRRQT